MASLPLSVCPPVVLWWSEARFPVGLILCPESSSRGAQQGRRACVDLQECPYRFRRRARRRRWHGGRQEAGRQGDDARGARRRLPGSDHPPPRPAGGTQDLPVEGADLRGGAVRHPALEADAVRARLDGDAPRGRIGDRAAGAAGCRWLVRRHRGGDAIRAVLRPDRPSHRTAAAATARGGGAPGRSGKLAGAPAAGDLPHGVRHRRSGGGVRGDLPRSNAGAIPARAGAAGAAGRAPAGLPGARRHRRRPVEVVDRPVPRHGAGRRADGGGPVGAGHPGRGGVGRAGGDFWSSSRSSAPSSPPPRRC